MNMYILFSTKKIISGKFLACPKISFCPCTHSSTYMRIQFGEYHSNAESMPLSFLLSSKSCCLFSHCKLVKITIISSILLTYHTTTELFPQMMSYSNTPICMIWRGVPKSCKYCIGFQHTAPDYIGHTYTVDWCIVVKINPNCPKSNEASNALKN